jgi:hypothetical protein
METAHTKLGLSRAAKDLLAGADVKRLFLRFQSPVVPTCESVALPSQATTVSCLSLATLSIEHPSRLLA